jgi:hypothetical protein
MKIKVAGDRLFSEEFDRPCRDDTDNENLLLTGQETLRYAQV